MMSMMDPRILDVFFVGNVNDNVNGYVWMILDVFGCCYEHILSNV